MGRGRGGDGSSVGAVADSVSRPAGGKDGDGVRAPLAERIARRIGARGPMAVSEYVEACLYDADGGFYMRPGGGRAGGRCGHFLTAPEVGPLFGAVLARALDAWWAELGEPEPFTVIDWGAGPGTLARSILAAEPGCMAAGALRLVLVELSPGQRALHPEHPLVASAGRVSEALAGGASAGVVVANELLDNLPFDVVRRTAGGGDDGWEELRVADGAGGRFSLVAAPAPAELVAGLPEVAAGARVPVQRAARRWVAEARRMLGRGRVVAFDYGAATDVLADRAVRADRADRADRAGRADDPAAGLGWLRTHRDHHHGTRWLDDPGSCDITADVALDQVQSDHRATACSQAEFLRVHGIDELVAEGRTAWAERAGAGDLDALRARSRTSEAEALLDPAGMGAFNVLVWPVG